MSEAKREQQLSILLDDELDREQMGRILDDLSGDREMRVLWDRYHLIGDALRGEPLSRETMEVAERVRERLSEEPALTAPPRAAPISRLPRILHRIPHRWVTPFAGSALVASVATIALVAGGWLGGEPGEPLRLAGQQPPAPVLYRDRTGTYWSLRRPEADSPEMETKLNSYLVNHQEYAPASRMKVGAPHVTFASYDSRR